MRLASYRVDDIDTYGIVHDSGTTTVVSDLTRDFSAATLRQFLAVEGVAAARRQELLRADHLWAEVEPRPVIPDPAKVICVGVNYVDHRAEAKRAAADHPTIFTRFADSQLGHLGAVHIPQDCEKFDYEGEVAVVIGRDCRRVSAADAYESVAGYACYNDFTARDWQRHTAQWTPGKNFPGTGGFGPWLVTPDEIDDVGAMRLTTTVNGDLRQDALLSDLIFDIPSLVEYISAFTALAPGDVIVTGTPGGVGFFRDPQQLLTAGDLVEVSVTGLGTLRNPVA